MSGPFCRQTIADASECASIAFSAERIMSGVRLSTKVRHSTAVARLMSAATEPVLERPVLSG